MKSTFKSLTVIVICMIAFSSCSYFKSMKKSQTTIVNPPAEERKDNKRSNSERNKTPEAEPEIKTPEVAHEEPTAMEIIRPEITFNDVESANVRISKTLNNPFGDADQLVIDMDGIACDFHYPYPGKVISQYGYRGRSMHTGVDIKAVPMDTIRAALPGVVRMSKPYSGYGNIIVIRHYNGIETLYSHHAKSLVTANDVVESGTPIALAGRTGRATTEHLHFEVRVASEAINPNLFLDTDNHTIRSGKLYLYNRSGRITAFNTEKSIQETEPAPKSVTASTATNQNVSGSGAKYHTVKKGDTLSQMARTYSTSVSKICALNSIKSTKILSLNEKLRVK